jgi:enoyl-CoA hydratase/carnithine racemase
MMRRWRLAKSEEISPLVGEMPGRRGGANATCSPMPIRSATCPQLSDIETRTEDTPRTSRYGAVRDRMAKKNAITRAMYAQWRRSPTAMRSGHATSSSASPVRFSSGNDLADFMAVAAGGEGGMEVYDFLIALATAQKPIVSGVDGIAVGIGTTINLHCDLTLATPRTVFRTPFVDLGLVPEAGSSLLAPKVLGRQNAFALLGLGEGFSAERAREVGLIHSVVTEEELEDETLAAAERVAQKPPEALKIARDLMLGDREELVARIRKRAPFPRPAEIRRGARSLHGLHGAEEGLKRRVNARTNAEEPMRRELATLVPQSVLALAASAGLVFLHLFAPIDLERFFGGIPPIAMAVSLPVVAVASMWVLRERAGLCLLAAGRVGKKIALAALLSTPFAVPPIVVDLVWVLGSGNFVDLPDALVFYPVMAFVAETVFHLLPLAILVGLAGMRRQP